MVIRHSATPFAFRSSNFSIFLNELALNLPGRYIDHSFDGLWDNDANPGDYFDCTVGNGPNYITFNINSILSSLGSGSIVPTTLTRIGRVRIPITNPSACNNYTWRLVPMAVRDWNGVNIKPLGNWINSASCINLCNPCSFAIAESTPSTDIPTCLAKDVSGNYYMGGTKGNVGFLTKYQATGTPIWSKNFGSSVNGVVINASGNAVITGGFLSSTSFAGLSYTALSTSNSTDAYIAILDANGDVLNAKKIGNNSIDEGRALAQDISGNLYMTGIFNLTVDFDPNAGEVLKTSAGLRDIFVLKLNSNLDFQWVFNAGSNTTDWANAITVNNSAVYVTGQYQNSFLTLNSAGSYDGFVLKLDINSGALVWASSFGNTGAEDKGASITSDASGNVYVCGTFQGNVLGQNANGSNADVLLFSLDTDANLRWSKKGGGNGKDVGYSISMQGTELMATGYLRNGGSFTGSPSTINGIVGSNEIFVVKYSESGNFVCFRLMGGTANQEGRVILMDGTNYILAGVNNGVFVAETDDVNTLTLTSTGSVDGFLMLAKACTSGAQKTDDQTFTEFVSESNDLSSIKIYPQPTSNELFISDLPDGKKIISVYDLLGKLMIQVESVESKENLILESFSNGIYLVEIQTDKEVITQKIIKN